MKNGDQIMCALMLIQSMARQISWTTILVLFVFTGSLTPQTAELVVQRGHSLDVVACDISQDGRFVASGGSDGVILWETATGREIRRMSDHAGVVAHLMFTPNGESLLTASSESATACLWNLRSGERTRCVDHGDRMSAIAVAASGDLFATAGGRNARVWSTLNGEPKSVLTDPENNIASIMFSPDGRYLATGNVGGRASPERKSSSARIWELTSGTIVRSYEPAPYVTGGPDGVKDYLGVFSVGFVADGQFLIIADIKPATIYGTFYQSINPTQPILMFETGTGRLVRSYEGSSPISTRPNRADFLAAGGDRHSSSAFIWNALTGDKLKHFEGFMIDAQLEGGVVDDLALSYDGRFAIVATNTLSWGGTGMNSAGETALKLFDTTTGRVIRTFEGRTRKMLSGFSGSKDGSLFTGPNGVWNIVSGTKISFEGFEVNDREYSQIPKIAAVTQTLSRDGSLALVIDPTRPGFLHLYEVATAKRLRSFDFRRRPLSDGSDNTDGWLYSASAFFSPDSSRIYLTHYYFGSIAGSLICWSTGTGRELWHYEEFGYGRSNAVIEGHDLATNSDATMSADGKVIAVKYFGCERQCYSVFQIRLLNALTGRELRRFDLLTGDITDRFEGHLRPFAFSNNGRYIRGVLSLDKRYNTTAYVLDTRTGAITTYPTTRFQDLTSVFSPDDRYVVDGGWQDTYVWNDEHAGAWVESTTDLGVRLLDRTTLKVTATLDRQSPTFATFTRDGRFLFTTSNVDHDVRMWDIEAQREVRSFVGHTLDVTSIGLLNDRYLVTGSVDHSQRIWDISTATELCRLASMSNGEWVVTTPDGRFDTNKEMDTTIEGLHWIISDDPLTPKPLELFMRQYYEPGLLRRVLKCNEENNCDKEFKPLPSIAEINRVQPKIQKPRLSVLMEK